MVNKRNFYVSVGAAAHFSAGKDTVSFWLSPERYSGAGFARQHYCLPGQVLKALRTLCSGAFPLSRGAMTPPALKGFVRYSGLCRVTAKSTLLY
ncbi:hypothetical protein KCP73_23615 [Salmonella enterica subsp. enterica]|nr:hypothetical protein KCP73_23615 [Salmonella enterica subsp. enterica]